MKFAEIIEAYKQVWARDHKGGVKRKYRCTSGPKKGRVVAKPSTCSTPTSQTRSTRLKRTRRSKSSLQAIRRSRTVRRPTTKRVYKLNRPKPRKRK
jgi:hypothetical protein